jgi:putative inorganic carbon (HCO3(-)) transporter
MLMRNIAQKLLPWEWLILVLLIPVTLLPFGAASVGLLLIPLLWLVRKATTGRWIIPTPYDLAIWLLLAMVGVSFAMMFEPLVSGPKIAGILLGIGLFYATAAAGRNHRGLWPIVGFVLLTGTLMAVVGLVGAEWQPPFAFLNQARAWLPLPGGLPGAVGGIVNANELAGVLSWVLPLMLGCLLAGLRRPTPVLLVAMLLLLAALLFNGFILVATLSRGGMLAVALGLLLVVALVLPPRWRLVLAIGLAVGLIALGAYAGNRLDQNLVGDAVGLSGRLEIWSRALLGIADFPLTGMGVNGFRRVVHALYPLYSIPAEVDLGHAHNHLLQTALDLGLPGLVAYVAIWWISAALLWSTYRRLQRRRAARHPYYGLMAGLAGSLLAGWVFGIFDAVALGARPGFLWWLLLGLTAGVHYAVVYSGQSLRRGRHRRASQTARPSLTTPASRPPAQRTSQPAPPPGPH